METFDCSFMEKILLSKVSDRIDNVTNLKKIKFYEKLLTRVCSMFKLFHNNTVRILSQDSLSLTEMIEERREIQQRISARSHQNTIKKLLIWNIINFEDDNATAFTDDEDENGSFSAIVSSPPALPLRHSANDNSEEMMIMVNGSRGKEKEVDGSCDVLTTGEISINIINNNGVAGNGSSSIDMDTSLLSPFPSSSKKKRKRGSKKNGSGGSGGESSASRSFSKKKRKRGRKKNGSGRSGGESSASSTTSTASSTSTSTTDEDETRTTKVNDVTSCLKQDDYASSTNFQDKARLQIEEVVNFETSVNVAAATTNYVSKNVLMVNNEMDAFSTPESVSAPLIQPDLLTTANGTENCDGLNVFTALPPQLFKDTATTANTGVNVLSIIETPTTKLLSSPVHTKKDILCK